MVKIGNVWLSFSVLYNFLHLNETRKNISTDIFFRMINENVVPITSDNLNCTTRNKTMLLGADFLIHQCFDIKYFHQNQGYKEQ